VGFVRDFIESCAEEEADCVGAAVIEEHSEGNLSERFDQGWASKLQCHVSGGEDGSRFMHHAGERRKQDSKHAERTEEGLKEDPKTHQSAGEDYGLPGHLRHLEEVLTM
jgi:hypothetical protein